VAHLNLKFKQTSNENLLCLDQVGRLEIYNALIPHNSQITFSPFGWLVADGWCWFVLREEYCWLVAGGWFVVKEKYCWLVADKPSEQGL
jgi:hypothetical protein